MENLIDIMQLSTEEIDELVKTGCDIMEHPAEYAHATARSWQRCSLSLPPVPA